MSEAIKINADIETLITQDGDIQLLTTTRNGLGDVVHRHSLEIMRTKDEATTKALIKLGWTPPGCGPSLARSFHEENARTLQGILNNLRLILGAADGESITDVAQRVMASTIPDRLFFSARNEIAEAAGVKVTDETNKIIAATLEYLRNNRDAS